jgi:hypothetical protein
MLISLALALAACAPLETSTPLAPANAPRLDAPATAAPDYAATAIVADAAARYAAGATQTAEAVVQVTRAAEATATSAGATALWSGVSAAQTQTALTATMQFVAGQQATGTQQAGIATATASAAAPIATATYQAQVLRQAEESRNGLILLLVSVALFVFVVVVLAIGGQRWIISRGIEREQAAAGARAISEAQAEKIKTEAKRQATIIHQLPPAPGRPGRIVIVLDGYVTQNIPLPAPPTSDPSSEPPCERISSAPPVPGYEPDDAPYMTNAQKQMIAFVEDAIGSAKFGGKSNYIPTDSDMGRGGADWTARVKTLKEMGVVETSTGRPGAGQYGTRLVARRALDLNNLLDKLQSGALVVPVPSEVVV